MALEQLDLFGNIVHDVVVKKEKQASVIHAELPTAKVEELSNDITLTETELNTAEVENDELQTVASNESLTDSKASLIFLEDNEPTDVPIYKDDKIVVKLKAKQPVTVTENEPAQISSINNKRGRKSYKELEATADLINVPDDETLQKKLYYGIGEVAEWFNVNASQIRFWENEFDILKPRKTKKGDRLFRIEDIKNLQLIYHLLRTRKFSIEGAKDYLKTHKEQADVNFEITQSLTKFRSFLLELKANLGN
jgi:DNA-binding transcriptional MerR regulator